MAKQWIPITVAGVTTYKLSWELGRGICYLLLLYPFSAQDSTTNQWELEYADYRVSILFVELVSFFVSFGGSWGIVDR